MGETDISILGWKVWEEEARMAVCGDFYVIWEIFDEACEGFVLELLRGMFVVFFWEGQEDFLWAEASLHLEGCIILAGMTRVGQHSQ